jgi:hypothetical protein
MEQAWVNIEAGTALGWVNCEDMSISPLESLIQCLDMGKSKGWSSPHCSARVCATFLKGRSGGTTVQAHLYVASPQLSA